MSDLPLEGRVVEDKKEVPFTLEQQVNILRKDVQELARGVNTQGALLEAIVKASDHVVQKYLELTRVETTDEKKEEKK